jgi:outer membrane protein assembly factor BamB
MATKPSLFALVIASLLSLPVSEARADWTNWRGPRDSGAADAGSLPVKFGEAQTRWIADLPGKGCSTPIVHNQVIYVTAPVENKDALLAFDWEGKLLWTTKFGAEDAGKHRNGSGCNASPVTDGEAVFVYFKSGTLAAVELDGRQTSSSVSAKTLCIGTTALHQCSRKIRS